MYIEKRSGLKTCAYYGSKNSLAVLNVIYIVSVMFALLMFLKYK